MNDYEKYVTEVNNIFSILEKLKNGWTNSDNLNHIEQINEFRRAVISGANFLEKNQRNEERKVELSKTSYAFLRCRFHL